MGYTTSQFNERTQRQIREQMAKSTAKVGESGLKTICERNNDGLLRLVIIGQIRGGKNNITVTRTGKRFPNKVWANWRDKAVSQVLEQLPDGFPHQTYGVQQFIEPVNISLDYVAGDKRRRDMPAIIDSIFHVLEKAGVVSDDTLLWVSESSRSYDKQNPRAVITFLTT
jgi:hypothetical protein